MSAVVEVEWGECPVAPVRDAEFERACRGVGVAGLVGSRDLIQYAFVGRTINVAARVQDLTRNYDADILVTRELQQSIDPRFRLREFPPANIRGISEPVGIYAVDGHA